METSSNPEHGFSCYRPAFVDGLANHKKHYEAYMKQYQILPRERYFVNPPVTKHRVSGEQRWAKYESLLNGGLVWKLHKFQLTFLEKIKMATCSVIHGEDWKSVQEKFLSERGWDSKMLNPFVLGSAPRRFGKSVVVGGVHIVAFAISMPNSVQAMFSTGRRASQNTLNYAYKTLVAAGYKDWIKKYNQEELEIADPETPYQTSKMFFYPSNAKVCHILSPSPPPPSSFGKKVSGQVLAATVWFFALTALDIIYYYISQLRPQKPYYFFHGMYIDFFLQPAIVPPKLGAFIL